MTVIIIIFREADNERKLKCEKRITEIPDNL